MSESRPNSAPAVYRLLIDQPNLAVEDAVLEALPALEPQVQSVAVDTLIERNREPGMLGLVAGFRAYGEGLQRLILARAQQLYAGARLALAEEDQKVRLGAVEFVGRSGDVRLAYLLAEALCEPCPKTREAAAHWLRDLTGRYLDRLDAARRSGGLLRALQVEGDYIANALRRAVEAWDLHLRVEVLTAALWMADRLEDAILAKAESQRSSFGRAVLEQYANPDNPRLGAAALLALKVAPIRTELAKRISHATDLRFARGLMMSSWLLRDPAIAHELARVRRWAWLERTTDPLPGLTAEEGMGASRLIAACTMPVGARVRALGRLIASPHAAAREAAFWKLVAIQHESAATAIRTLGQRGDTDIARLARRELKRRERRFGGSPSASLDGAAINQGPGPGAFSSDPARATEHPFDRLWEAWEDLSEEQRAEQFTELSGYREDLPIRLRKRLAAADAGQRGQALAMVKAAGLVEELEEQVYRATSDSDPVTRCHAVTLLAELNTPTAQRIARRALNDPDERVQANAVEVCERLGMPEIERALLPKLSSDHARVRANAVAALLKLEAADAAETLLDMLEAPERDQRISALWVVEHLRLISLLERLQAMTEADPDERIRRRARRVLSNLQQAPLWVNAVRPEAPV